MGNALVLPLPLYSFLEVPVAGHNVTVADELRVDDSSFASLSPCEVPRKVPPLLRFGPNVPFDARLSALQSWLSTRSKEEMQTLMSSAFAAELVEAVGGMSASHRFNVATILYPLVNDPQRLFLLLERVPKTRLPELVEAINKTL